jgi:type IV secretion system protein VirB10
MPSRFACAALCLSFVFSFARAQEPVNPPAADANPATAPSRPYTVEAGTRIALGLINSVSTRHSAVGDRIYLETVFPIVVRGRIVIPQGSSVSGSVTQLKRAGRVHGKSELFVRFDSLILPNGVTRDFRSRLGNIDARGSEHLDQKEGMVKGDSNKGGDARVIAEGGLAGASIGAIAGSAAGHAAAGAGIGAAAGVATGLATVLLTRGPDAVLAKGSTLEMILDRPLVFEADEVPAPTGQGGHFSDGPGPALPAGRNSTGLGAGRRIP